MKKFTTALNLFSEKMPNVQIRSIEQTFVNRYWVVTISGESYTVDISNNSVSPYYDDPE